MCKSKNFYALIPLLGLLVLAPQICKADMAVGFSLYFMPVFSVLAFLGVWIIEARTISNRLKTESARRAFFTSLAANLVTVLVGWLWFIYWQRSFFMIGWIVLVGVFFVTSVIFEILVLYLFYRRERLLKLAVTSFLMNLASYLFLVLLIIIDAIPPIAFIEFLIIPYFLFKSFELLNAGREISQSQRKKWKIFLGIISVLLMGLLIMGVMCELGISNRNYRIKAKNTAIKSSLDVLRAAGELYYDDNNPHSYLDFENSTDVQRVKKEIENYGGNLIITVSPDGKKWCADSNLNNISKGWCAGIRGDSNLNSGQKWCVDSRGKSNYGECGTDYSCALGNN